VTLCYGSIRSFASGQCLLWSGEYFLRTINFLRSLVWWITSLQESRQT